MLEHEERGEGNDKPIPAEDPANTPGEEQPQIDDAGVPPCPCILPAPALPPERINITRCPSCGESHDYIEVKQFSIASSSATHWYLCPKTGDPATLIINTEREPAAMLRPDMLATLIEAQRANRYVFAIFWVAKDDQHAEPRLYRTWFQNDFPIGDMPACVEWLQKDFAERVGPPAQQPLPAAPTIKPLFKLLGEEHYADN